MNAADLWVDTYVGPVRADQIIHVATNMPQMSVHVAVTPANIEKLSEDRWFAEMHAYGLSGGEPGQNEAVARELIREISFRRQEGVPGIIQIDEAGTVTFEPFI